MALITNNISGSSSDSWRIGITGSVRIANPGAGTFPDMPGTDVDFFVSGSRGGKGTSGVSVFGGDTVVSGTLVVGTGSVTIDSNEIRFQGGAAKIFSGSGGLTFSDSANANVTLASLVAAGPTESYFSSTTAGSIFTTGSAAFRGAESIDSSEDKGTDVKFYVSGSNDQNSNAVALFGGNVVSSGTFVTKAADGSFAAYVTNDGVVSGSSDFRVGGGLTVFGASSLTGSVSVVGDVEIVGGVLKTAATTFNLVNNTATTLNVGGAATNIQIGSATGATTVKNNLIVKGDLYISGTTTTIDSTVTEIKDPIIGFGFASGSVAATAGDRGFIGGITGAGNNVAFVWSNSNSTFAAAKTVSVPGDATVTLSTLQPILASTFQVGGSSSTLTRSGTQLILSGNVVAVSGSSVNFVSNGTGIAEVTAAGLLPKADVTFNLGSPSQRWQNIYTGDLHLRNDRGDYTLIEESDTLTIRFNKTGKRYRFVLERAPEFDEEPL